MNQPQRIVTALALVGVMACLTCGLWTGFSGEEPLADSGRRPGNCCTVVTWLGLLVLCWVGAFDVLRDSGQDRPRARRVSTQRSANVSL